MGVRLREKRKGVWYVVSNHDYRQRSWKIGDKKTAEQVAGQLKAKIALGDWSFMDRRPEPEPTPTLAQYAETFRAETLQIRMKRSTARSYNAILEKHILPKWGKRPIDGIERREIKTWLVDLMHHSGLSRARIDRVRAVLSSLMTAALDDGWIAAHPCARLGGLFAGKDRPGRDIPEPYSRDEAETFLNACYQKERDWYPLFLCLLHTGMRIGEAAGLQWGDLDFRGGFLVVRRAIVEGRETTPKSGKARPVGMTPELAAALRDLRTLRKHDTLERGWGDPPPWVFVNREGRPVDPGNIHSRVMRRVCDAAGLRKIRLHDFRHTYATIALQAGAPIEAVSKSLGHSSIKITIDIYAHYIPSRDTRLTDVVGAMYKKETPG